MRTINLTHMSVTLPDHIDHPLAGKSPSFSFDSVVIPPEGLQLKHKLDHLLILTEVRIDRIKGDLIHACEAIDERDGTIYKLAAEFGMHADIRITNLRKRVVRQPVAEKKPPRIETPPFEKNALHGAIKQY